MRHSWCIGVVAVLVVARPALGQTSLDTLSAGELAQGKLLFDRQCVRCHGVGGAGGEGPPLTRSRLRHAPDDETLVSVVANGIDGTGMPRTWQMNQREIRLVAGYVRSLGRVPPAAVRGDPSRGRTLYQSIGCANCHIVRGSGESFGPELTDIGARRGPEHLGEALLDPGASLPKGVASFYPTGYTEYLPVHVVTRDGREVRGVRVNEDTFTVQVRDADRRIHSFTKRELTTLEREPSTSLMPSYRDRLSGAQLDDLVAYLVSLRGEP